MDINQIFLTSIRDVSSGFQPNELAYLSLTSKPEGQLRDAIAFQMYNQCWLKDNSIAVDREWKRTDLAVMHNNLPVILAEFKCAYTFDFTDNRPQIEHYGDAVIQDLAKSIPYAKDSTSVFGVLFAVHPLRQPRINYYFDIKYSGGINRSFSIHNAEFIFNSSNESMKNFFSKWNIETKLEVINCGEAFGVPVQILAWILGPYTKHQVASILDSKK